MVAEGDEFFRTFCGFLAQISDREKKKAIEVGKYADALVATILEGIFREAETDYD